MKITFLLFTLSAAIILSAQGSMAADEQEKKTATSAEAKMSAGKWLDALGEKGLVIEEKSDETALIGKFIAGPNATSFRFSQDNWWITVGFSGNVTEETSLKELQKRLTFVALDKMPTPGLVVPGWEIKPQTPTSRIEKGIEIVDLKDGLITLKVKTECFALYGTDPKAMMLVPADAGAPASAYFQIRKPFTLDLTLTAPFTVK